MTKVENHSRDLIPQTRENAVLLQLQNKNSLCFKIYYLILYRSIQLTFSYIVILLCVLFLQIRPTVCSRTATKSPITINESRSHEKSSYMRNSCFASPQNSFYRKFNRLFSSASLSCESATSSAERTALLGAASQRSLLLSSDLRDEDTLL